MGAGTFTVQASEAEGGNTSVTVFNSAGTTLNGPSTFSFSSPVNFASQAIPLNGNLVIEIDNASDGADYTVTVNTTAAPAPEPGTIATAALGLAGAVALARRRGKQ